MPKRFLLTIDQRTNEAAGLIAAMFDQLKNGLSAEEAEKLIAKYAPLIDAVNAIAKNGERRRGRRRSDAGFDLIGERAGLAAVQADNIALDVARNRGDVIPKAAMAEALNFLHGNIRTKLLALPARFRSVAPGTTAAQYVALDSLVREVLTRTQLRSIPSCGPTSG